VKFDDGSWCWIYIPESSHLDCEPWTLCDEHGNPVAETDWQALAGELAAALSALMQGEVDGMWRYHNVWGPLMRNAGLAIERYEREKGV